MGEFDRKAEVAHLEKEADGLEIEARALAAQAGMKHVRIAHLLLGVNDEEVVLNLEDAARCLGEKHVSVQAARAFLLPRVRKQENV